MEGGGVDGGDDETGLGGDVEVADELRVMSGISR
jgi:hypothetical protein